MFNNSIAGDQVKIPEEFTLIVFNIEESQEIDLALYELQSSEKLEIIHFLLLQEMDELGVEKIAESLHLNYLYYPIGSNSKTGTNFGSAILTKFPISEQDKLILPHEKVNKRIRNATNCIVHIGDKRVLLYSIHNETIVLPRKKREDQVDAILSDISMKEHHVDAVIVGGDFNSMTGSFVQSLKDKFTRNNFRWANEGLGFTSRVFFGLIRPVNDQIYVKNVKINHVSKMIESKSSDHMPLILKFTLD